MDQDQKVNLLSIAQSLEDEGEYEQALNCLKTMECVMASWLKGKIYLSAAEELSKSFAFTYYATTEIKSKYRFLLNESYNHLYNAAMALPNASQEVRDYLNDHLWIEISKVENELTRTKPIVEEENMDIFDESLHENQSTQHLIDQIADWNL